MVAFVRPDGAAKSTLLRELAHRLADDARSGGRAAVVLLDASALPLEDVLQELFGLLHDTDRPYLPSAGELRSHLQGLNASVLVDDVDDRSDVRRLLDVLPDSGLLLTASRAHDIGDVLSLPLRGLPADDAAALARASSTPGGVAAERVLAGLVQRLGGLPGALATVAAGAGTATTALQSLAAAPDLRVAALAALPGPARDVLRVLAAVPGLALTGQEVSAVTAEPAEPTLHTLVEAGLVDALSAPGRTPDSRSAATPGTHRYRATVSTAELVRAQADLSAEEQALFAVLDDRLYNMHASVPTVQDAHATRLVILAASRRGRWREVLRLGRATEAVLALAGRWGSWYQVLTAMLVAARRLHDDEAESFTLHQLGTRALCLGQAVRTSRRLRPVTWPPPGRVVAGPGPAVCCRPPSRRRLAEAEQLLTEALQLRQGADDVPGAEVTEHDLRLLTETPAPPDTGWRRVVRRLLEMSRRSLLLVLFAAVVLVALAAVLIRSSLAGSDTRPPGASTWQLTPEALEFGEVPGGRTAERSVSLSSTLAAGTAVREASRRTGRRRLPRPSRRLRSGARARTGLPDHGELLPARAGRAPGAAGRARARTVAARLCPSGVAGRQVAGLPRSLLRPSTSAGWPWGPRPTPVPSR